MGDSGQNRLVSEKLEVMLFGVREQHVLLESVWDLCVCVCVYVCTCGCVEQHVHKRGR